MSTTLFNLSNVGFLPGMLCRKMALLITCFLFFISVGLLFLFTRLHFFRTRGENGCQKGGLTPVAEEQRQLEPLVEEDWFGKLENVTCQEENETSTFEFKFRYQIPEDFLQEVEETGATSTNISLYQLLHDKDYNGFVEEKQPETFHIRESFVELGEPQKFSIGYETVLVEDSCDEEELEKSEAISLHQEKNFETDVLLEKYEAIEGSSMLQGESQNLNLGKEKVHVDDSTAEENLEKSERKSLYHVKNPEVAALYGKDELNEADSVPGIKFQNLSSCNGTDDSNEEDELEKSEAKSLCQEKDPEIAFLCKRRDSCEAYSVSEEDHIVGSEFDYSDSLSLSDGYSVKELIIDAESDDFMSENDFNVSESVPESNGKVMDLNEVYAELKKEVRYEESHMKGLGNSMTMTDLPDWSSLCEPETTAEEVKQGLYANTEYFQGQEVEPSETCISEDAWSRSLSKLEEEFVRLTGNKCSLPKDQNYNMSYSDRVFSEKSPKHYVPMLEVLVDEEEAQDATKHSKHKNGLLHYQDDELQAHCKNFKESIYVKKFVPIVEDSDDGEEAEEAEEAVIKHSKHKCGQIHSQDAEFQEDYRNFKESIYVKPPNLHEEEPHELESLWEHQDLIEQLRMELRKVREIGLPTITEESESPKSIKNMRWKLDSEFLDDDPMDELHKSYKSYRERLRKFDILNYQKKYAISFLEFKDHLQSVGSLKQSITSLFSFHRKKCNDDRSEKHIKELQSDLELVYVGQVCLSWEFLRWQYETFLELTESDHFTSQQYNQVTGEFLQFQVVMQRFLENEPFHGNRVQYYVKNRCVHRKLLQVPVINEDHLMEKMDELRTESDAFSGETLIYAMEKSIRIFWEFIRTDKDETSTILKGLIGTQTKLQNPTDSDLIMLEIQADLHKKEKKLKGMLRNGNCLVKKFNKHQEDKSNQDIFFSQVDIKLISRVLRMSGITTDQLMWCQKKLSNIRFFERKHHREPSFCLFPC